MDIIYTIIIPHYNIPNLLKRLLDTIPQREDLQVIVVDDCSTKNVEDLDHLKDEYKWVEWYSTGKNGGGGKARNIGLDKANGKYVIFADADDFFTPGLSLLLDKYKDASFDMVIFSAISLHSDTLNLNVRATDLDNRIKLYSKNKKKGEIQLKYLFGEPWCRIIRTKLITENKIRFEEIKCHNDTKFTYLVSFHTLELYVDSIVGYVVTFRSDSVINTKYNNRYEIEVKVFSEKQQFFIDHDIPVCVRELYSPLFHDIVKFRFEDFWAKYNDIRRLHPNLPIKSLMIKQGFNLICEKLNLCI